MNAFWKMESQQGEALAQGGGAGPERGQKSTCGHTPGRGLFLLYLLTQQVFPEFPSVPSTEDSVKGHTGLG